VLLKDFSGSEKLADGDTVKADVVDAGVINDYHLVAGGGVAESLHSYSADVSRFEKKIIKTPQTTTPCSTCKGRGTVNNPDRNKMGSVKCTKCKGVGYFIDERATETFVWVKKTDTLKP
jgi:DnaJ-class molecular chaperone